MNWLRSHLIEGCRHWWKFASVWLAGAAGIVSAVMATNQGLLLSLLAYVPSGPWRIVAGIAIFFTVAGIPTLTRLWKQTPPNA